MSDTAVDGKALLEEGDKLRKQGSIEEARQHYEAAAKLGEAMGYIELASLARSENKDDAARVYFRLAQELADRNHDALALYCCGLGHQVAWDREVENLNREARRHFRKAAELGLVDAQCLMAEYYYFGMNGTKKNREKYEYWIARAIALGDEDAFLFRVENLLREDRDIDEDSMARLSKMEDHHSRKLWRRVIKRMNASS